MKLLTLKRMFTHRYHTPLLLFAILATVFAVIALVLDRHHFWFHIAVEGTMAALTLLATVWIVEDLLEYRREQDRKEQWAIVQENTLMLLRTSLFYISVNGARLIPDNGTTFNQFYHDMISSGGVNSRSDTSVTRITDFGKTLYDYWLSTAGPVKPGTDTREKSAEFQADLLMRWYRLARPYFETIRKTVIPRLMQFAPNHAVMKEVLRLEVSIMNLEGLDTAIDAQGQVVAAFHSGAVVGIVQSCAEIFKTIATHKEED